MNKERIIYINLKVNKIYVHIRVKSQKLFNQIRACDYIDIESLHIG